MIFRIGPYETVDLSGRYRVNLMEKSTFKDSPEMAPVFVDSMMAGELGTFGHIIDFSNVPLWEFQHLANRFEFFDVLKGDFKDLPKPESLPEGSVS